MRDRRALTVRLGAAAGVAAMAVGLVVPTPRLLAQKPDDGPGVKAPAEPQGRESPPTLPDPKAAATSAPAPLDSNPLPPALPTPSALKAATTAWTADGTLADPEGAAKAFVERSQKEADEAINTLAKEAETLRAAREGRGGTGPVAGGQGVSWVERCGPARLEASRRRRADDPRTESRFGRAEGAPRFAIPIGADAGARRTARGHPAASGGSRRGSPAAEGRRPRPAGLAPGRLTSDR